MKDKRTVHQLLESYGLNEAIVDSDTPSKLAKKWNYETDLMDYKDAVREYDKQVQKISNDLTAYFKKSLKGYKVATKIKKGGNDLPVTITAISPTKKKFEIVLGSNMPIDEYGWDDEREGRRQQDYEDWYQLDTYIEFHLTLWQNNKAILGSHNLYGKRMSFISDFIKEKG